MVSAPSTPVPKLSFDESESEQAAVEDELITDQAAPSEYSEERVQGLVEEMEKLSVSSLADNERYWLIRTLSCATS